MKKLALAFALMLTASPLAIAQTTTPKQEPSPNAVGPGPGTATTKGQEPSPNAIGPGPGVATTQGQEPSPNTVAAGQPQWYSHQANELRASKLIGTSVRNGANESIGSINELILSKDGKVSAVVIGVGGFLGIGEREVAMNFNSLKLSDDNGKPVVVVDATKETLKAAPAWQWQSDRSNPAGTSTPRPPATPPSR